MDNTSLIFIALHDEFNDHVEPIEYFIDISKIIAITPLNHGGTIINTVSTDVFYCKESVDEVIKLMDEAFKNAIKNRRKEGIK